MKNIFVLLGLVCFVFLTSCCDSEESSSRGNKELAVNKANLTIVARILAKDGEREFVKSELLKLIDITKAEEGCVDYVLHQDNENPNFFIFYENWESRELWQKHIKNNHVEAFGKITKEAVQKVTINEMTMLK